MDNKLTTHDRFIKKFERDLKALHQAGDDAQFMRTFNKYTELTEPSETIEELLYETLMRTKRQGELVDYALEQMNNGDGDYEMHMVYMLKALLDMGNYEEVLEFSEHLLEELLPQSFRIDILSIRQYAGNKMRGVYVDKQPVVTEDEFAEMNLFEQLEFIESITKKADFTYTDLIKNAYENAKRNELKTAMLLYLRSVRYNDKLTIEKCGIRMQVNPAKLEAFEAYFIVENVLPKVLMAVEEFSPSFTDAATELLMGHAIYMYPVKPEFTTDELAVAYVARIQTMLGQDDIQNADDDAVKWLEEIERDIAENAL